MQFPKIGITSYITEDKLTVPTNYITAVSESTAVPIILPKVADEALVSQQIDSVDGLLLTGGDDIEPALFNADPHPKLGNIEPGRDAYESLLIEKALERGLPVLGICRGAQILNISQGGTMYQDLYDEMDQPAIQHSQNAPKNYLSHSIEVEPGSILHDILGTTSIRTNSFHHQSNHEPGEGLKVTARTSDGVVEAMESVDHKFVMALQWHPEASFRTDDSSQKIFRAFVRAAIDHKS